MNILIVDDEVNIRRTTAMALKGMGHEAFQASDAATAMKILSENGIHVTFLDLKLKGDENGLELIPKMLETAVNLHVVVFTAYASIETAVEAIKRGASDYVEKPFTPAQIRAVLGKLEKTQRLQARIMELETCLSMQAPPALDLFSASPKLQRVFDMAGKAAASDANILITGESGTGKNMLASRIHQLSRRKQQKFVMVSCPCLTKELLASELFGHVRGAFTGALRDNWGKVAVADRGTLFLDEIGDLPLDIQPKLLRLLQEKEYERVGETFPRKTDVRVLAATNHDLEREVVECKFREDLYYRLNVITIPLPPLRDRREDLEPLAKHFLYYFASQCGKVVERFSDYTLQWMKAYDWPGNVRELRNLVERAVILADSSVLHIEEPHAIGEIQPAAGNQISLQVGDKVSLKDLENAHICRIIRDSNSMEEAARVLGIDPATLYRKRKRLAGLQNDTDKTSASDLKPSEPAADRSF